jgi:predicted DNA-binding ribbon-helix-helix protein
VGRPSVSDRDRREPLSVSLPQWQWEVLKQMAKEHDLSRSSMIADAVGMWLKGAAK